MWTSGKSMSRGRVRTRKLTKAPRVVGWTLDLVGWSAAGRGGGALLVAGLGLIESETLNPTRKRPWQPRRPFCRTASFGKLSVSLSRFGCREGAGKKSENPPKNPHHRRNFVQKEEGQQRQHWR